MRMGPVGEHLLTAILLLKIEVSDTKLTRLPLRH
jgi:hypothetical protein